MLLLSVDGSRVMLVTITLLGCQVRVGGATAYANPIPVLDISINKRCGLMTKVEQDDLVIF